MSLSGLFCVLDRSISKFIVLHFYPRQFARASHSTSDALVYLLQAIYEALDTGNCGARLFFADFSKGFDMVDHEILISELRYLSVHPVLINWTQTFLSNRTQAVRIGGTISDWKSPKGGISQAPNLALSYSLS